MIATDSNDYQITLLPLTLSVFQCHFSISQLKNKCVSVVSWCLSINSDFDLHCIRGIVNQL